MNKTFIIIIGVAIVVVFFLYAGSTPPVNAPITQNTEDKSDVMVSKPVSTNKPVTSVKPTAPVLAPEIPRLVVFYTDQGFTPSIREVNKGEEVTFINNSSKGMRIASFQKENLGYYPGLSQPRTVARGEAFKFIFLEAGAWNYHNLNYENHTGIVVVR